jgi:hypothetical protein
MSKKFVLGMFMPFGGFRFDSGVTNSGADLFPEIITDPQTLDDSTKKNIVRKIRGIELYPCEKVKFSSMKKYNKK